MVAIESVCQPQDYLFVFGLHVTSQQLLHMTVYLLKNLSQLLGDPEVSNWRRSWKRTVIRNDSNWISKNFSTPLNQINNTNFFLWLLTTKMSTVFFSDVVPTNALSIVCMNFFYRSSSTQMTAPLSSPHPLYYVNHFQPSLINSWLILRYTRLD